MPASRDTEPSLRVVVIEDNDELRATLVEVLRDFGHEARGLVSAEEWDPVQHACDLLVIDLNLPGEDGLSLARRVRQALPFIGIVMVTARRLPQERARGYAHGADLYLVKPLSFDELGAAVRSLARRLVPQAARNVSLNREQLRLQGPRGVTAVSSREADLLVAFCSAPGQRLAQWQIVEQLDTSAANDPVAAAALHLVRLRKKLDQVAGDQVTLHVIRGWGYQLGGRIVLATH